MTNPAKWVVRVFLALIALPTIAALGFYLRPVSYLDAHVYLQEHFIGIESHNIKVDGYRMHYLAMGPASGPAVILVHGLGGRAEDWWNVAPVFAKAGFRVYMPDLLGFGRSQQPADFSYSVRDQAAVVVDFMSALGVKQADVAGWSMGGWIVQLIRILSILNVSPASSSSIPLGSISSRNGIPTSSCLPLPTKLDEPASTAHAPPSADSSIRRA